jgi:hypothetical protein
MFSTHFFYYLMLSRQNIQGNMIFRALFFTIFAAKSKENNEAHP